LFRQEAGETAIGERETWRRVIGDAASKRTSLVEGRAAGGNETDYFTAEPQRTPYTVIRTGGSDQRKAER